MCFGAKNKKPNIQLYIQLGVHQGREEQEDSRQVFVYVLTTVLCCLYTDSPLAAGALIGPMPESGESDSGVITVMVAGSPVVVPSKFHENLP